MRLSVLFGQLLWSGSTKKEIFKAVDGQEAYQELYGPFSEWHHWRIGGFGPLVRFHGTSGAFIFNFSGEDPATTETALASAVQCLIQTLQAVDEIAQLGITAQLERLRGRYIAGLAVT